MKDFIPGLTAGLVLGAAIGAAIGFLLAPLPGREIRTVLKTKAADVPELVKEATGDRKKQYVESWKETKGDVKKYHRHKPV